MITVVLVYRGILKTRVAICAKRLVKCANLKVKLTEAANITLDLRRSLHDLAVFHMLKMAAVLYA